MLRQSTGRCPQRKRRTFSFYLYPVCFSNAVNLATLYILHDGRLCFKISRIYNPCVVSDRPAFLFINAEGHLLPIYEKGISGVLMYPVIVWPLYYFQPCRQEVSYDVRTVWSSRAELVGECDGNNVVGIESIICLPIYTVAFAKFYLFRRSL